MQHVFISASTNFVKYIEVVYANLVFVWDKTAFSGGPLFQNQQLPP